MKQAKTFFGREESDFHTKWSFWKNDNTLTGPANCKKTTRHYTHLSLCAKSKKTNDAKWRKKKQKPELEQFFDDFEVKYLQIANISEK